MVANGSISQQNQPRYWKVDVVHPPLRACFDQGCLLYNPLSGSTHRVNDLILEILDSLGQEAADAEGLLHRLELGADGEEFLLGIKKILLDLDRLGLIFPWES